MTDSLVQGLTAALGGKVSGEIIIFIISMIPILELLPSPFILLLIEKVLDLMEKIPGLCKIARWVRQKADKNKGQIEKFGFWGLALFVGIPLPGTGAWTGSLVAALLHMKFGKAIAAILVGIAMATIIMSLLSYGLLGALFG